MQKTEKCMSRKSSLTWYAGWVAVLAVFLLALEECREPYVPPAIQNSPSYLVVDGFLNGGQDSSVIRLSRTRNLDSLSTVPEPHAQVIVIGDDSVTHPLYEETNGYYGSPQLGLNGNIKYRLRIFTNNGQSFQSDTFSVRSTPPIDSVTWKNDNSGVGIYVNAHDPLNNTWYYRWDYTETWQYHTYIQSSFEWVNDQIIHRPASDQIYDCWTTSNSTDIHVSTTTLLAQDVVSNYLLNTIPTGSEKMSKEYSILVRQYAITADAYSYWQNLKQNTEQVGGLFDPQPSQVTGNIHCLSNPKDPVLGFISASTVSSQRIFISTNDLTLAWGYVPYYTAFSATCVITNFQLPQMIQYFDVPGPLSYTLLGQPTGGQGYLVVPSECADCSAHGGSNIKPSYWPF